MYTVMIIDDEKWVRSVLRCTIEELNLPVRVIKECQDADEALEWLAINAVDLVLTDIRMPMIDGLTFIKEVKRRGIDQDFIVISMYEDFCLVQEALRLKVFDYILKPIQFSDVEACLQKWLSTKTISNDPKLPQKQHSNLIISKVLNFIEDTPLDAISLSAAANYVHISPNYLSTVFKQYMNINFVEYVMQLRINEAKKLLEKTEMTVADIGERLGYADLPYFSNFFKKVVGCTPSEYRNRCKKVRTCDADHLLYYKLDNPREKQ
jgi:YesN/AraC family two-component response regulator